MQTRDQLLSYGWMPDLSTPQVSRSDTGRGLWSPAGPYSGVTIPVSTRISAPIVPPPAREDGAGEEDPTRERCRRRFGVKNSGPQEVRRENLFPGKNSGTRFAKNFRTSRAASSARSAPALLYRTRLFAGDPDAIAVENPPCRSFPRHHLPGNPKAIRKGFFGKRSSAFRRRQPPFPRLLTSTGGVFYGN
jgi:hypothetical protein